MDVEVVDVLVEVVDVEDASVVVLLSFTVKLEILLKFARSSSMTRSCSNSEPLVMLLTFSIDRVIVVESIAVTVVRVVVVDVVVVLVIVVDVAVIGQIGGRQEPSPVKRVWYAGHAQMSAEVRRGEVAASHAWPWPRKMLPSPLSTAQVVAGASGAAGTASAPGSSKANAAAAASMTTA